MLETVQKRKTEKNIEDAALKGRFYKGKTKGGRKRPAAPTNNSG